MKRNLFPILVLTVAGTLALAALPAQAAKVRVVTTLTDLADLTRNIGGAFGIAIFSTILVNATNANVLMVAQNSHILGTTPVTLALAAQPRRLPHLRDHLDLEPDL